MRELDEDSRLLAEEVKAEEVAYIATLRRKLAAGTPKREAADAEVEAALEAKRKRAMEKIDEKVAIAGQTYDLVDNHVRRLDHDLRRFERVLREEGVFSGTAASMMAGLDAASAAASAAAATGSAGGAAARSRKRSHKGYSTQRLKKRGLDPLDPLAAEDAGSTLLLDGLARKEEEVELFATPVAEEPVVDPNEPLYCICRKVSYGAMVGCDNDDCPIEWFHFECVGRFTSVWLTSPSLPRRVAANSSCRPYGRVNGTKRAA
eukprot:PLAT6467.1.p1 GENE.PLAT6467.1~~PLAT6467.1.p1  ORF type:complete len:290 (+),score=93.82 PLAT6467.1:85-870(+)